MEYDTNELIYIPKGDIDPKLPSNPFVPPIPGMIREDGWILEAGPRGGLRWIGPGEQAEYLRSSKRWIRFRDQPYEIQKAILDYLANLGVIESVDEGILIQKKVIRRGRNSHTLELKKISADESWAKDLLGGEWKLIGQTPAGIELWEHDNGSLATSDWPGKGFYTVGIWIEDGFGWAVGLDRKVQRIGFQTWLDLIQNII